MKILRRFLILIPLFLASCSERQEEPATQEEVMDTALVALREAESNEEDSGEEDSLAEEEMQDEDSVEDDNGEADNPNSSATYPQVTPVPGQPGFVYSPYNNMVIDVRDLPSGTLVADPSYPPSEKKYFRVP